MFKVWKKTFSKNIQNTHAFIVLYSEIIQGEVVKMYSLFNIIYTGMLIFYISN